MSQLPDGLASEVEGRERIESFVRETLSAMLTEPCMVRVMGSVPHDLLVVDGNITVLVRKSTVDGRLAYRVQSPSSVPDTDDMVTRISTFDEYEAAETVARLVISRRMSEALRRVKGLEVVVD